MTVSRRSAWTRPMYLVAAFVLLATLLLAAERPQPAHAASNNMVPSTSFEIDGNIEVEDGIDWGDPPGTGLGSLTEYSIAEDACGTNLDNTRLDGDAHGTWDQIDGSPNNKADLCSGGFAFETVVDADGKTNYILYGYFATSPSATGDLSVLFPLYGPEEGRHDDLLLEFDFNPAHNTTEVRVYEWTQLNSGKWEWTPKQNADGKDFVFADNQFDWAVGQNLWESTGGNMNAQPGTFAEFALNLTSSGIIVEDEDTCELYQTGIMMTRTGNNINGKLQDYLLPDPVTLSTCGDLTVIKKGEGDADTTFTFDLNGEKYDLKLGEQTGPHTYKQNTKVIVTETLPTADLPWASTDVTCVDEDGNQVAKSTGTSVEVTIVKGKSITCTFTNVQLQAPTAEKSAKGAYDRTYNWKIAKSADETRVEVVDNEATFSYTVAVTPDGFTDSNWAVAGAITVTNPNTHAALEVDVTDEFEGTTCVVTDGTDVELAAGESKTFNYVCELDEKPSSYTEGTNTATIAWSGPQDSSGTVYATDKAPFELDEEANKEVTVSDDLYGGRLDGEATWNAEGTATEFTYELTHTGVPADCVDFTNTAVIDQTEQSDSETVTICVEDVVTVTKEASATFDRDYAWDLTKSADKTRAVVGPDGKATFEYTVTATPGDRTDSNWQMSGLITVTNPNDYQEGAVTVTVTDETTAGATCTVVGEIVDGEVVASDGVDVPVAPTKSETFVYECDFGTEGPETYEGHTNTATVTWIGADGQIREVTSVDVPVKFEIGTETNKSVDVYDDKVTLGAPGEKIGTAIWNDKGTPTEITYTMDWGAAAGKCESFTNTAVIRDTGDKDSETVTVCAEAAPEVTKTAEASYDRTYNWSIAKSADQAGVEITGTEATFNYTVAVTPEEYTDSGWQMSGVITVTNPNAFAPMTVTVTDKYGDVVCDVTNGADVTVPPGGAVDLAYSCDFGDTEPAYQGVNTASVTWQGEANGGVETGTFDVEFELGEEVNKEVTVSDDLYGGRLEGEATWNADGTATEFTYELTHTGVPTECVDFTNTAVIDQTEQSDSETVTICVEDKVVVTKTATATYDRDYHWTIDKDVDRTEATVNPDETAKFSYLVSATPNGYTDSNWQLAGTITVTNPNEYAAGTVTVEVTDNTDVGATCTVANGSGVEVAPEGTEVFDYTCTFPEGKPQYTGQNLATVTWEGPEGTHSVTSVPVEVDFTAADETNHTVEVFDDMVTGSGTKLGEATWNANGAATSFSYELSLGAKPGECTTHTNTAAIPAVDAEDSVDVEVCGLVPEKPAPEKEKSAKPVIPSGDPVAGGPQIGLITGGLLAMALAVAGGIGVVARRKRG